jgi:hypothetical protein
MKRAAQTTSADVTAQETNATPDATPTSSDDDRQPTDDAPSDSTEHTVKRRKLVAIAMASHDGHTADATPNRDGRHVKMRVADQVVDVAPMQVRSGV